MKKKLTLGRTVQVSAAALKGAEKEFGTQVSSVGKIIQMDTGDGLVTVEHDGGQKVDWHRRSLTVIP